MKIKFHLLILALVGFGLNAHALDLGRDGNGREIKDGRDGNGGADAGLDFRANAEKAIADVVKEPKAYPEVIGIDLSAKLSRAEIFVVDQPLFVRKLEIVQESTAVNYPAAANCTAEAAAEGKCRNRDAIFVNGPRWEKIRGDFIKRALALHEVLGLAGIETTGDYTVSGRYLKALGIQCESGLCDSGDEARYGPMRFHAICLGAGRGKCVNPPDSATDFDRYPVMGGGSCKTADHEFVDLFEEDPVLDELVFKCNFASIGRCARLAGLEIEDVGIGTDGRCYSVE